MKPFDRHVLLLTPHGKDGPLLERLLATKQIHATRCGSLAQLTQELDTYTGAVLLTDDMLVRGDLSGIAAKLDAQPSWSDVPFVILLRRGRDGAHARRRLEASLPARLTNAVYLERPTTGLSLLSTMESVLQGRQRQFQIRDELRAANRINERLRLAEARLVASHDELDQLVRERTQALEQSHAKLREEVAERERAEAALIQSQKMEAVGRLTGGIAHDFNNLLMALVGNLALASHHLPQGSAAATAIENARRATERGTKLAAQLLAFSRIQKLSLQAVMVDEIVEELGGLARHTLGQQHRLEIVLGAPDRYATADPNQLELAILNLVANARDAMPDGGTITIRTGLHTSLGTATDAELGAGEFVSIEVADTGVGIEDAALARIFEPFYTTKPVGKGTGLGLAQVWGITHQCGGSVQVSTVPDKGTRFTLYLPETAVDAVLVRQDEPATLARGQKAVREHKVSVLLVDDDDNVREALAGALEVEDFHVLDVASGEAALPHVDGTFPDVLVVDFSMPGMDGATVARLAQRVRPGLPVVLITGYADTAALDAVSNASILTKPFALDRLTQLLLRETEPKLEQ